MLPAAYVEPVDDPFASVEEDHLLRAAAVGFAAFADWAVDPEWSRGFELVVMVLGVDLVLAPALGLGLGLDLGLDLGPELELGLLELEPAEPGSDSAAGLVEFVGVGGLLPFGAVAVAAAAAAAVVVAVVAAAAGAAAGLVAVAVAGLVVAAELAADVAVAAAVVRQFGDQRRQTFGIEVAFAVAELTDYDLLHPGHCFAASEAVGPSVAVAVAVAVADELDVAVLASAVAVAQDAPVFEDVEDVLVKRLVEPPIA